MSFYPQQHARAEGDEPRKRKKRKLPKIISQREAAALMRAAEAVSRTPDDGVRNAAILTLMYRAGLRVSEVVAVKPGDISDDGTIRLYDAKGGDGTSYFAPDLVWPILDRWLEIRARWGYDTVGTPVFVKKDGSAVSVRLVQRLVKKLKSEIGIPEDRKLTPHVLRHTFATELIEEGWPIHEVQGAMRHANLATTAVYLHVRDEGLRRRMSRRSGTMESSSSRGDHE